MKDHISLNLKPVFKTVSHRFISYLLFSFCIVFYHCIYSQTEINKESLTVLNNKYFQNNQLYNGIMLVNFESGQVKQRIEIKDGVKEGDFIEYYLNGKKKAQGPYKNNLQNGSWSFYLENGILKAQGSYINGNGSDFGTNEIPKNNRDGIWKFYSADGKIEQEQLWFKNQMTNLKVYFPSGKLQQDQTWNGNQQTLKKYYPSGNLEILKEYSNTLRNNYVQTNYFDENGKIDIQVTAFNNKPHGPSKRYYRTGQLKNYLVNDTNAVATKFVTEFKEFDESGNLTIHLIAQDGNLIDQLVTNQTNNTQVASSTELNKTYKCMCCKATINGVTDGLNKDGGEYSDWHFNYYNKLFGTPEMKDLIKTMAQESEKLYVNSNGLVGEKNASSKEFSVYDVLRGEFKYCSLKCSHLCKDE